MSEQENNNILNEILPVPSNTIIKERFVAGSNEAPCSGLCDTGQCKGML